MLSDWTDLPPVAIAGIADRIGGADVVPATSGDHAEIAATVIGTYGSAFVKAAHSDLGIRSLRYELLVGETLKPPRSPAVLWHFETDGWLVAGFEQLDGPHADLSPGSPDLAPLASALAELSNSAVSDVPLFSPLGRLGFEHPAMDGTSLVHTDLNPANLVVTSGGLRIVDWAYSTKAAPWVELALLAQWLIGSGHTPYQAEGWLARHAAWNEADPKVLDDFAARNAAKWSSKAEQTSLGWVRDLAAWTAEWSIHRRSQAGR
jgi:hypothetical protein